MSAPENDASTWPDSKQDKKSLVPLMVALALVVGLPFLGNGGILASIILACALLGAPLFVIIGIVTVACFVLWAGYDELTQFSVLIERMRTLADTPPLLAIPLFIMSGTVMSKGQISVRLVDFARALVGWIPGGLAMSAVLACMLFAAISGSSPATVIAIGGMMGPSLIKAGYNEKFSHGLLTSAGSLGILIPPSIPMIIYPIVNQRGHIEVEALFASGFGPGLLMGSILIGFSFYQGLKDKTPRDQFSLANLWRAAREGFWALMFPIIILGGIYGGFFNAVEASGISVVYAIVVEIWIHRALETKALPGIIQETGIFLGSLLVIMVAALSFSEFLEGEGIPALMVEWIHSLELEPWQFLLALNVLLLIVGMAMDILSAMFVFVPLLAPIAMAMGVDPMHFGIIFIVNLEIGYLTPPVGLNLFVASSLFEKPIGHVSRSVLPFIALMLIGLGIITYIPAVSVGFGRWIMGTEEPTARPLRPPTPLGDEPATPDDGEHIQTIEEMMRDLEGGGDEGEEADGRVLSMDEMMEAAEAGDDEGADAGSDEAPEVPPAPEPDHVLSMDEMMEAAGVE